MLYRKQEKAITKWLQGNSRTALLISGVRQAGKTYLIEETLKSQACDYVKFDFIEQAEVVGVLKGVEGRGTKDLLAAFSVISPRPLTKGETIIFFDEVQRYPEIVTMIKYLVDEGSFRYVLSGSLLGVELRNIRSAPVGYMQEIQLYPLDFEEFLYATTGMNEETVSLVEASFLKGTPVPTGVHNKLLDHFYKYLAIGGMPQAVQAYVDENDLHKVMSIHNEILPMYRMDFTQYEEEHKKLHIVDIYDLIPAELNEKNKRYVLSDLDGQSRTAKYQESFQWLVHAGVAIPTYNASEPRIPLLLNQKSTLFKLFLSDVGMLATIYGQATVQKIIAKSQDINYGAIFENAVAQELNAHGNSLYYFNSKTQGEVDFLIERGGQCLPIEVKSGKEYYVHSALDNITSNDNYGIKQAYVLCNGNVEQQGKITYLPIYMAMFL